MISVCLASFNGEKYIKEQINSILTQLSPEDELIISDDGSTDDTLSIINSLMKLDNRIKLYKNLNKIINPKYKFDYTTHNFENAILQAKGEVIFLADQDDVWFPNKVKTMIKELDNVSLVCSDCIVTDEKLNHINESYYKLNKPQYGILNNILKCSFLGSCMAFRRELIYKALPFPKHGVAHDLWLGLIALDSFNVSFIKIPLMYYRRHDQSISSAGKENYNSLFFKLKYRFLILKSYLKFKRS